MFLSAVVRSCYLNSGQAASLLGSPSGVVTGLAKTERAHKLCVVPLGGFYPPFRRSATLSYANGEGDWVVCREPSVYAAWRDLVQAVCWDGDVAGNVSTCSFLP